MYRRLKFQSNCDPDQNKNNLFQFFLSLFLAILITWKQFKESSVYSTQLFLYTLWASTCLKANTLISRNPSQSLFCKQLIIWHAKAVLTGLTRRSRTINLNFVSTWCIGIGRNSRYARESILLRILDGYQNEISSFLISEIRNNSPWIIMLCVYLYTFGFVNDFLRG